MACRPDKIEQTIIDCIGIVRRFGWYDQLYPTLKKSFQIFEVWNALSIWHTILQNLSVNFTRPTVAFLTNFLQKIYNSMCVKLDIIAVVSLV